MRKVSLQPGARKCGDPPDKRADKNPGERQALFADQRSSQGSSRSITGLVPRRLNLGGPQARFANFKHNMHSYSSRTEVFLDNTQLKSTRP